MPTYTYVSVDRVTPSSGTVYGGTAVTITGSGFDLATDVTFDGTSLTSIVYVSNTSITGVTATHGSGAVDVVVVGVGTLTAGYEYTIPVDKLPPQPYYNGLQEEKQSPSISMPWSKWLDGLKQRAENPVLGPSTQVPAESVIGVLAVANIPQLPSSRLTFTNSPRLLGRTSAGSGDSEEISVVGGLVLENGTLSARLVPGGYTVGDIFYADSLNSIASLADVSVGSYLRSGGVATAPLWSTLKLPNAGTVGDVPYVSATNVVSMLPDVAAGSYLRSGGVTTAPVWSTVTIPNAAASGDIWYGSATSVISALAKGSDGQVLWLASGLPAWTATSALSVPYTSITSVPTATVLGRNTAGTGAAEALGTLPSAVQLNITSVGVLAAGSTAAGFGALVATTGSFSGIVDFATTVRLPNNVYIRGKDTGGNNRNLIGMNASDQVAIASDGQFAAFGASFGWPNNSALQAKDNGGTYRQILKFDASNVWQIDSDAFGVVFGASVDIVGKVTKNNNITTAGWGVPAIYAEARSLAQTTNVASVAAYTVGAADGSFLVSANVNVTTSTTHNFTVECAYTDETNTPRVLTFTFSQLSGVFVTAITNVTGAGPYEGVPMHIRCKASTSITIRTQAAGTYTSIVFNVEGCIAQVA